MHHRVFAVALQVLAVTVALAQTGCKVETKIRDSFYDRTAPDAAQSLAWLDPSNGDALVGNGDFSRLTSMKATWTPSTTTDMTAQGVQLYIGAACNIGSGAPIRYSGVTQSHHVFSGLPDGSYSFKVISYDRKNNASFSACSTAFVVDNSAPAIAITTADAWINHSTKAAYTVTGTCTDSGAGITGVVTVRLSQSASDYLEQTTPCTSGLFTVNLDTTSPTAGSLIDGFNHLTLTASVTDQVGNSNLTAGMNVSRDTIAPTLSGINPAAYINIANKSAYTVGGSCIDAVSGLNGSVSVIVTDGTNTVTGESSCTGAGTFLINIDASSLSDTASGAVSGNISITTTVADVSGNSTTTAALTRKKDTVAPVLAITSPTNNGFVKSAASVPVSFSLVESNASSTQNFIISFNNGTTTASSSLAANNGPFTVGAPGFFSTSINTTGISESTLVSVTVSYSDLAGNPATVASASYTVDTGAPTITAFSINSGATNTTNNYVKIAMSASDGVSKVQKFCLKNGNATLPSATDSCWVSATQPNTNASPGLNVAFTNYDYLIGFVQSSYTLYAWVMDEAGNISSLSPLNVGTAGVDKASIFFDPGTPPAITALLAANTDTPSSPPTTAEKTLALNGDLYVKWIATDAQGLADNPISIFYTTNDTTYSEFSGMVNIDNDQGAGCTLTGGYTGCRKLQAPTSDYFRVRVVAKDSNGTTVQFSSDFLNNPNLKIIAGNMESGLGGSALSAVFNTTYVASSSGPPSKHRLAVTEDGKIFYRDRTNGLLWINPLTGVVDRFIPVTGVSSTDSPTGTPIASATLNSVTGITIDHENNLLIYDHDRIRKVNLSTMTITTLVGGGSTLLASNEFIPTVANPAPASPLPSYSASAVKLSTTNHQNYTSMIPMPNGDLYFTTDYSTQGFVDRKYVAATQTVEPVAYTGGQGYSNMPTGSWTVGETAALKTYGSDLYFSYDASQISAPISYFFKGFLYATVGSSVQYVSRINFNSNNAGVGPYDLQNLNNYYGTTALDGKIYVSPRYRYMVSRYNPVSNTSVKLVGTTSIREGEPCPDGTSATACQVNIDSYFVNKSGRLYFVDQGLIRTINDSDQVVTLFGQYASYGNGVLAQNSRIGNIASFKLDTSVSPKRIVTLDSYLMYYRDVAIGGNTSTLTYANYDGGTGSYKFLMDPSGNGDFYAPYFSTHLKKYSRTSGNWTTVVGGGSTDYYSPSGDGLVGTSIRFNSSYAGGLLGWFGSKLILEKRAWSGTVLFNCMAKMYDSANLFTQSNLIGVPNNACVLDYTLPKTMDQLGLASSYSLSNIEYEPTFDGGKFIFGRKSNQIYKSTVGGAVELVATLPASHTFTSFVHTMDASGLTVYYCSNEKIQKWNQTTGASTLDWGLQGIGCYTMGLEMYVDNGVKKLIVPVAQNGLYGYVEYTLP